MVKYLILAMLALASGCGPVGSGEPRDPSEGTGDGGVVDAGNSEGAAPTDDSAREAGEVALQECYMICNTAGTCGRHACVESSGLPGEVTCAKCADGEDCVGGYCHKR